MLSRDEIKSWSYEVKFNGKMGTQRKVIYLPDYDIFSLLGLTQDCSDAQFDKALKRAMCRSHPDKHDQDSKKGARVCFQFLNNFKDDNIRTMYMTARTEFYHNNSTRPPSPRQPAPTPTSTKRKRDINPEPELFEHVPSNFAREPREYRACTRVPLDVDPSPPKKKQKEGVNVDPPQPPPPPIFPPPPRAVQRSRQQAAGFSAGTGRRSGRARRCAGCMALPDGIGCRRRGHNLTPRQIRNKTTYSEMFIKPDGEPCRNCCSLGFFCGQHRYECYTRPQELAREQRAREEARRLEEEARRQREYEETVNKARRQREYEEAVNQPQASNIHHHYYNCNFGGGAGAGATYSGQGAGFGHTNYFG